ncbi:hypothetical protein F5B19DRAFT_441050 [Rostrohypoxylon terebratum]|nr:hypothetical protein F5B19DRAFT_441050 [Rostrohypoxylon terebratum]
MIPGFQIRLRQRLLARFKRLRPHRSVGQLLAVAFEGETRLNWVKLRILTATVLDAALKSDALKDATELSIRIDLTWGKLSLILDAISSAPPLRHVCFVEGQSREDDEESFIFWKALLNRQELLKRIKFTFTGAYSKALNSRL